MSAIAIVLHLLSCALDLDHCARWTRDPWGVWCSAPRLGTTCPAELEQPGWHSMAGISVCTRECGAEGAPVR